MGLMRIAALIIVLSAVSLLVLNQSRSEITSAIYWYCQPLKLIGVSQQRLAARLVLTIESVTKLQSRWANTTNINATEKGNIQQQYQRVLQLFKEVVDSAETDELKSISFSLLDTPRWYQWFIPLSLMFIFWLI